MPHSVGGRDLHTCPYASMRASSVHFAATRRAALLRRLGGVCWMMSEAKMKPWWGYGVVLLKPAKFLRLAPKTCGQEHGGMTSRGLEA
jgi:hypothetical protein